MEQLAISSVWLPHCWVCHTRFTDSVPPGPANKEVHHVIPRKAGGTDGPTFTICDLHHARLHKIADRLGSKKKRPYHDLLVGETPETTRRLMWLAVQAYNAFALVKDDPNRKIMLMMGLSNQQQQMIESLKRVYPTLKSREAIVDLALRTLYAKHFM
jgi:hypothetical protein